MLATFCFFAEFSVFNLNQSRPEHPVTRRKPAILQGKMTSRISLYFLLLVFWTHGNAQNIFKFEHITVNDGLSHSDAMAVIQDKDGFIWVGTNKGLDRYDGYTLKNYRLPYRNVNGQYTNRVLDLHLSQDKTLWVVPETQGIFYYDPKSDGFKNLAGKARNPKDAEILQNLTARSLSTSPDGDLFIGTSTEGLYVVSFDPDNSVKRLQRISFPLHGENALIFAISPDRNGRVWVGTVGLGLWCLTKTKDGYIPREFTQWAAKTIRAITVSHDSDIWVASEEEVIRIHAKDGQTFRYLDNRFSYITSLLEDSYQRLWIGSRTGLYLISQIGQEPGSAPLKCKTNHFTPDDSQPSGLNYHLIHNMVEDSFNNLWIAASAGGLNKVNLLPKPFFRLFKEAGGLPNDYTNTICRDKDEEVIWIGTRSGFARYHIPTGKVTSFLDEKNLRTTPTMDITSIYDAGNGFLWIATRVHGVYLFNKKSRLLTRLPEIPGQKEWKAAEPISITSDRNGLIWIACFYDGLHIYDPSGKHIRSFSRADGSLISGKLTFLLSEPERDAMWLSTRDAGLMLLKLQGDQLVIDKRFSFHPQGLKTDYIWPLTKSRNGDLWVGTIGGGLHRIDGKSNRVERYDQWLPETDVESILEDENGKLWIGGNGLYRLDPESKTYLHFDVADGLQSNSFKVASAARGTDGILYFGGIGGVTYFNPKNVSTNPHPPKMQITQVRILNYAYSPENKNDPRALISGPFSPDDEITIKAFENDFSLEFVGLNYINPGKQHYEYKLEGYHKNWISLPQGQRVMGFSNLPSGNYTFLVKADNGDGVWTEEPASLKLRILPPWYRTWWAYLFYSILVTSAVVWYKRVTGKQRELKNKIAIEQVAKEKEKELADLKLNFFTNVSHELRTPLTLIMSPSEYLIQSSEAGSEARQKAELVHKQAHKLLDLVNQLMNFRKVETGNVALQLQTLDIVPFITEIFLIFKLKADEQETRYTLTIPDQPVWVNFDPEKLEIVLTNLLSNAFKYTPENGSIEVRAECIDDTVSEGYISISVKDSGTGIHEDELSHIFEPFYQAYKHRDIKATGTGIGLSLVHELVKKHKGEIAVASAPGQGSVFTVKLPFGENRNLPSESREVAVPEATKEVLIPDHTLEYKLLIVEDNEDLRVYLVSLFHSHFETHAAANGREGLEKVGLIHPDIILSDVMMPVMNGLEFCEKVKNNPRTAHIPLVLLTARAAALHELEGLETGADDYIVKPFNPRILYSKIISLLNNRKKAQEYFHRQILVEPSEAVIPDADRIFIRKSMQIIEENLTNENFSVQTLVRESGMSQSAFYRRLKNLTGQSVIEFIKDVRLKRAAQLLSTKQFRVQEVGMMVGMEDLKNFRASFQKLFGVSPSEYGRKGERS